MVVKTRWSSAAAQATRLVLGATGWAIRGLVGATLLGSLLLLWFWFVLAIGKSCAGSPRVGNKWDTLMMQSGLVLFFLPIVAVPMFWVLAEVSNYLFSRSRMLSAQLDRRPPILVLRSFAGGAAHTSRELPPAGPLGAGHESGLLLGQRPHIQVYVLPKIAPLLAQMGQLIVIGDKPAETATSAWGKPKDFEIKSTLEDWISGFRNPRVAVCDVMDPDWEVAFRGLAAASSMIVSLPGTTPSALKEIRDIISWNLTGKLCFVMPPSRWGDFHIAWSRFREQMAGTCLPEYRETGMLFLVNPDLSVRFSIGLEVTCGLNPSKLLEHADRNGAESLSAISERYRLS
jgi:hypothetical protein